MTLLLFLISLVVLEAVVKPQLSRRSERQRLQQVPLQRAAVHPSVSPHLAPEESAPPVLADLLALNTALEKSGSGRKAVLPKPAPVRQPEYNESDVRAE